MVKKEKNHNSLFVVEIILSEIIGETSEILNIKKFYEVCNDDIEKMLKKGYEEIVEFIRKNMKGSLNG